MDIPQNELEQLYFLQHLIKTSEAAYATDPLNAPNLTRWGTALLEMASLFPISEAKPIIQDAMSKLEEALEVNPKNSMVLCQLGKAYLRFGLVTSDFEEARLYFDKAIGYLTKACEEEPDNELYSKSLAMAAKAPEIHAEFQQHQQAAVAGPSSAKTAGKKKRNSDLKYDIMGWIILAVGIVAISVYSKNHMTPPPPPR